MIERHEQTSIKTTLEVIPGIPPIKEGDNLGKVLKSAIETGNICLQDKDIIVIAQKIVSKAEGCVADLKEYTPDEQALEISRKSGRDPRLVKLIIQESEDIGWIMKGTPESPGIVVVKHRLGHMCSGAGIDDSNTGFADKDHVLLLPKDPDRSAKKIADFFDEVCRVRVGVVIIDTLGDRYRIGSIGKAIGVANVPARVIEENLIDLDGKHIPPSDVAFADSVAGLAMILMGQSNGSSPAVLIRGVNYPFSPTSKIQDVFI